MILDVRIKFLLILLTNYVLLRRAPDFYEWLIVFSIVVLFILARQVKKGLRYLAIYLLLYLLYAVVMEHTSGYLLSFLSMLAIGGRAMFPCVMAGSYLFATSNSSQLIGGLRYCKVPEPIVLTFAVMFRFLPIIKQDYRTIHQSLVIRGIFLNKRDIVLKPLRYSEYVLIPLLMSASQTAQDLTIATMTKTIMRQQKTVFRRPKLSSFDKCFVLLGIIFVICLERSLR